MDAVLSAVLARDIRPDDVEEVVVGMASFPLRRALTEPREKKYHPVSVVDAQFSLPFAAAVAIVRRKAFLDEFSEAGVRDPQVLAMAGRVRWVVDEDADKAWPTRYSARVGMRLRSGEWVHSSTKWPKGDPENPVSDAELAEKFLTLAAPVVGRDRAAALHARLARLESLTRMSELALDD